MNGINEIKRYYFGGEDGNDLLIEDKDSDRLDTLKGVTQFKAPTIQYELSVSIKEKVDVADIKVLLDYILETLDD